MTRSQKRLSALCAWTDIYWNSTPSALRFVPKGKTVVLGLITTKQPHLESEDELLRRIEQASKYVAAESLAVSTQCGFASAASGNLLSWEDMRRKLDLVAKIARKVWG